MYEAPSLSWRFHTKDSNCGALGEGAGGRDASRRMFPVPITKFTHRALRETDRDVVVVDLAFQPFVLPDPLTG